MPAKGERVKANIISAAAELFYLRGFTDTAFADLAEYSGIPKGNFYYYYKTKDGLLDDVISFRLQKIKQQLTDWESQHQTAQARIECFIEMVDDNAETLSRHGCPIGTLNSELGKTRQEQQQSARNLLGAYLDWLTIQFETLIDKDEAQHENK